MSGRSIAFFGDCQAGALAQVYGQFVAPLTGDRVRHVSVVPSKATDEDVAYLREADVVVSQVFNVEKRLDPDATKYCAAKIDFPTVFIGFLWPFSGQQPHPRNSPTDLLPSGAWDGQMGDAFLNRLIREGVKPAEALDRYLSLDIVRIAHLDRLSELHIEQQGLRDDKTGFSFGRTIEQQFRDKQLFLTSSHPALPLAIHLIQGVFERIGVPSALIDLAVRAQRVPPFPSNALPIHPKIIQHFGLNFVDPESRYPFLQEGSFTFQEYVLRYMDYVWNEELVLGVHLAHRGDPGEASEMLTRALTRSPDSSSGWRAMSHALRRLGRLDEARKSVLRSINIAPDDPANSLELAHVLLQMGDLAGAEAEARQAIAIFPFNGYSHFVLAHILSAADRPEDAARAAEQAIVLRPSDPAAVRLLSRLTPACADSAAAERSLRQLITRGFRAPDLQFALVEVVAKQNRREEATTMLHDIVRENTADPQVQARFAEFLLRENDLAGAEAAWRTAVALNGSSHEYVSSLADVLSRQGRFDEALSLVNRLLAEDVLNPHAHARLGSVLIRRGDLEGAERAYRKAVELDGGKHRYKAALADVLHRRERHAEALETLRQILADGVRDPHVSALLRHFLRRIRSLRDLEELEPIFRHLADVQLFTIESIPALDMVIKCIESRECGLDERSLSATEELTVSA